MAKILIVDDELKIREVVKEYAKLSGYEVYEAGDGYEAIELVKENDFNCILLDIMMPKLDGFSTCKKIKEIKNTPVIMLSARNEEHDKLFSFDLGIDDYVTKPFSPKELMARIKVVIDRSSKTVEELISIDTLLIDVKARSIFIDDEKINVTPKEYELLYYLVTNKNIALSREKLLNDIWKYDYSGDDRTVDTHIKMLRHNLKQYRDKIITMRGVGYKFED